jgi:hypothetical protein
MKKKIISPDAFGRRMTLQQKIHFVGVEIKPCPSSNVPRNVPKNCPEKSPTPSKVLWARDSMSLEG